LNRLSLAARAEVTVVSLAALWRMVAALGFAPSLDACARDGRAVTGDAVRFSVVDGGLLCATCGAASDAPRLPAEDRRILERLLTGEMETGSLPPKRDAAHRRLFARFVRRHASEDRELPALTFWEEAR
jgi:recombinational DNA repair protein (RecF pathway)